jgi:hypothetical protein
MTADDFRRLALDLDGVVEGQHMNHPDFRANGRIFASLHTNDTFGMVKVTPAEQGALMRAHPSVFVPSSGAWGRQGCTNVRLAAADDRSVKAALILAWEDILAKPKSKPNASRAALRPSRRRPAKPARRRRPPTK